MGIFKQSSFTQSVLYDEYVLSSSYSDTFAKK